MAVYLNSVKSPSESHTLKEFITTGKSSSSKVSYRDLSYIENRDNMEFVVKNTLSDYLYELKKMAYNVTLTDDDYTKYRYNPKRLAYDLYGTTLVYYIILLMNDMCDVHQFSLKSRKLILLSRSQMSDAISSIYKSDATNISRFNNAHEDDVIRHPIEKYR